MKKIIYMIILAAAVAACSDGITLPPAVSLFNDKPEILDETAIFRMVHMNIPEDGENVYPVTFGGSAVRGVDYEASADAFVIGGENPVDSIVVTTLKFDTGKTVSMTVELPEGTESGHHLKAEYTLQETPAYITFDQNYRMLADSTYVRFGLTDKESKGKTIGIDAEISVIVNKEKSTAVEGVDFEFADSSHFTIKPGAGMGELKIRTLKPVAETGKDRIVLSLSHKDKFGEGFIREMEISLLDTLWGRLNGKWKIDTLVTDTTYMKNYWGELCTGYDLFPEYNKSDAVSFDLESCAFEPSFRSDFDLYFTENTFFMKNAPLSLDLGNGESADLQTFLIGETNRYFSDEFESEDRQSLVGMRIVEGAEENPDTLDFYVIDYVSKSFMPELDTLGKYAPVKPVAASPGQYINITFVK